MSRKGKMPVEVPQGVEIKFDGRMLVVKGPKGTLTQAVHDCIKIVVEGKEAHVSLKEENNKDSKFHGLYRALLDNMVIGVSKGFEKILEMVGVGYRAALQGSSLSLNIGLSHPTLMPIPKGVEVSVEKNTTILIRGINKQQVGQFADIVRRKRPPEPYQGKGIRYKDEYIRRKAGKTSGK
jgi:large subunit ribosomal protein L6